MSTTTKNYGLVKPELTDTADITAMNENWDKIDEELKKTYSPENKPSKEDVGLGNVPNVATNNQTPTHTEGTTLEKLASGEKLSIALGKISKAITELISHIANKNNPHGVTATQVGADPSGSASAVQNNLNTHTSNKSNPHNVTASQVGAAPSSHNHSASDINSGTLSSERLPIIPVEKGGTGKNNLDNVKVGSAEWATWATHMGLSECTNKNFNDLKTPGYYFGYTNMTNAAFQEICVLEVIPYTNDWVLQRQTRLTDGKTFCRYFSNGTTWSEWYSVYTTKHQPNSETWTFTLEDGSTVTKAVYVG